MKHQLTMTGKPKEHPQKATERSLQMEGKKKKTSSIKLKRFMLYCSDSVTNIQMLSHFTQQWHG